MEAFSAYIRTIAVFLLLQSFVKLISPNKKYNRYIDFVIGLVLITIIISPISKILAGYTKPFDSLIPKLSYTLSYNEVSDNAYINEEQNKIILDAYCQQLSQQLESLIGNTEYSLIDSEFLIGQEESNRGEILNIRILVGEKRISGEKKLIRIDGVKVKLPNQRTEAENEEISSIKKLISDFYKLSLDNIYITIQEMN